jgi:UDP-GlcNAc:undecaprenyl-phosphate GlcNAc-1-phosphate transferase
MMTIEIRVIATFLAAFFAAMFVLPNLSLFAEKIGLVDVPNERKVHTVPRPLVGGIGIVIAATFSSLVFVPSLGLDGYFSGMILLLLVGFMDDLQDLGHRKKFMAQIVATTLLICLSKIHLSDFGNLLGWGEIIVPDNGLLVWGVTVFCVVGVTNAVNMIDGLDGLAGSISFVSFLTFAVLSSLTGNKLLPERGETHPCSS